MTSTPSSSPRRAPRRFCSKKRTGRPAAPAPTVGATISRPYRTPDSRPARGTRTDRRGDYQSPVLHARFAAGLRQRTAPKPPLGAQGARKGALPAAEQATAAAQQPLALADRNAGREGFVATRRWREAPEGIRTCGCRLLTTPQSRFASQLPLHRGAFKPPLGAQGEVAWRQP